MNVVAIAISCLALLVSLAAVAYARMQAFEVRRANDRAVAVSWHLAVGGDSTLTLTNVGASPAMDVEVVFGIDPHGAAFGKHRWPMVRAGEHVEIVVDVQRLRDEISDALLLKHARSADFMTITWTGLPKKAGGEPHPGSANLEVFYGRRSP